MLELNERDRALGVLAKKMPSYRKAYSDRTAWLMAYMAELAYLKFDPLQPDKEVTFKIIERALKSVKKGTTGKIIGAVRKSYGYDAKAQEDELKHSLKQIGWDLVETISVNATQAYVACNDEFAVLAFRGTEADRMKDLKADAKARQTSCQTGGRVHSGFKEHYDDAACEVEKALNHQDVKGKPLFITGHSLGGAVATIATKRLTADRKIAACYTYGSPRVGTEEWVGKTKTPIYRIVNSADPVPLVPFSGTTSFFIVKGIRATFRMIQIPLLSPSMIWLGDWLERFMSGYAHAGNMRYLTNSNDGDFSEVELLYTVGWSRRFLAFFAGVRPWGAILKDHGIQIYRRKLMNVAEKRNPQKI